MLQKGLLTAVDTADETIEVKQEMVELIPESEVSRLGTVQRPFSCDVCGRTYARLKMFEKHRLKHDIASQVNGTAGDAEAVDNFTLNSEVYGTFDGAGNKRYVCGECGDHFAKESEVKSHMLTKHMCKCCTLDFIFLLCKLVFVVTVLLARQSE